MGLFKKLFSGQLFADKKSTKLPVLEVHLTLPKVPLGDIQGELNSVADKYSPPVGSHSDEDLSKTSSAKTLGHNESLLNLHEAELKKQASELYSDSSTTDLPKQELAAFLGAEERGELRSFYLKCFDFKDLGILASLRLLCDRLYMRAESQHLDRIIDSFSERWAECNPKNPYRSTSHVYTLAYSIMLLNTDMNCADPSVRMSRTKYVQTTFRAITALPKGPNTPAPQIADKDWQDNIVALLRNIYNSLQETPLRLASVTSRPGSNYNTALQPRASMCSLRERNNIAADNQDAASVVSKLSHRSSWYQKSTYAPSIDSFDTTGGASSVGFSSALWNAVIREEYASSVNGDVSEVMSLPSDREEYDEVATLELFGPPWAKEGLLKLVATTTRKSSRKKQKDNVFVVVQRGYLKVFRFDRNSLATSSRERSASLGSGNWMQNATLVSNVALLHTTASVTVNNCWALTLPNGSQVGFQAGTNEIAKEYCYTCNYWAARVSLALHEELVTSAEYGWERPLNMLSSSAEDAPPIRFLTPQTNHAVICNGVRIVVKEWEPPVASTVKSSLDEEDQLFSFQQHLQSVEHQLEVHSGLKARLVEVYPAHAPVTFKVLNNWQKKNTYLLKEVVKFKLYVTTLSQAVNDAFKYASPNTTINNE